MADLDGQKLAAAKLWLISPSADGDPAGPRDLPYLASALYALIAVPSEDVERVTCDEYWRVYINPAWLDAAPVPVVGAELAHVTWHLLADHSGRARDMDVDRTSARLWDECADVTISHTLAPEDVAPPTLPDADDLNVRPGLSVEVYFALKNRLSAITNNPDDTQCAAAIASRSVSFVAIWRKYADSVIGAMSSIDHIPLFRFLPLPKRYFGSM